MKGRIWYQVFPDAGYLYDIRHSIFFPEIAIIIRVNVIDIEILHQTGHKGVELTRCLMDAMDLHGQGMKPVLISEDVDQYLVLVAFDIDFQKYILLLADMVFQDVIQGLESVMCAPVDAYGIKTMFAKKPAEFMV